MSDSPAPSARESHSHCPVCGRLFHRGESRPIGALRPGIASSLRDEAKAPVADSDRVCAACFGRLRTQYMLKRLEAERGSLSALEAEVTRKAAEHSTVAEDLVARFEQRATRGERIADGVARVGGSWPFVIGFFCFILVWMAVNTIALQKGPFDPYPYILLNLVLSCLAAIQAPIIMMSQNRSTARDRMQADQDFRVNLKAELEVAALHEKVDHLLHAQWESLMEVQKAQLDLLTDLSARGAAASPRQPHPPEPGHTGADKRAPAR